ncbi:DUF6221 family protein [Streptomyces brevispora]|uniref:DUF6221 family protein n=1 Tax=Streptomyces brevispora TaxID=887462 RepID=UPI002E36E787|nr:DUF6221 family protein [Streptomyces brevispora]
MTADLVQFLRDRLDEDEQAARACPGDGEWTAWALEVYGPDLSDEVRTHAARHDPARVLREVETKQRIVDRHTPHSMGKCRTCERPHWGVQVCDHCERAAPCPDLRDLAAAYADHPEYRPEWRP